MATLKISDLSVGDWVRWTVYNKTYDIRVTQITDTLIDGIHDDIEYGMLLNQISPIPITAEMLEKNGFECIEEDADAAMYGSPECSIFHTKGTLRYRLDTPQASVVCWNIHDLQHALRLAGVDQEINL
jgi:hypothetical protein